MTETDAKGQLTQYSYDALNRVTQIRYAGGSQLLYQYDTGPNALSRLSMLTNPNGSTSWGYDPHGWIVSDSRVINTQTFITVYRYDGHGQLNRITYPSGRTVDYSFDPQDRIAGIATISPLTTRTIVENVRYVPFGGVTGFTFGNGFPYSRMYGLNGQIETYDLGNRIVSLS